MIVFQPLQTQWIVFQHTRYEQAIQSLQNAAPLPVYQIVTVDEVQEKIQEAVRAHYQAILRDLAEADYASIGSVTQEVFREVLNKHVMRLNDEQVCLVWLCGGSVLGCCESVLRDVSFRALKTLDTRY